MVTIFVLAGSVLGFVLGMTALALGAGLPVAMMLWTGSGFAAAVLSLALSLPNAPKDQNALMQSA
jgi:hypothetical protein